MSIYAILVILLIALIAFFHWLQGFFGATISAVIAIISSMMAISYTEPLVNLLLGGKMADQAQAMVLAVMFAAIYILLRVVFDKAIPGNLRLPSTVDKVGGALMGVVAGIFAVGTLTLSAQMLPFGPTIAGYSRYALAPDRTAQITLTGQVQRVDAPLVDELRQDNFDQGQTTMLLPVDDWVVAMAEHLSNRGALSGQRPLVSVHPDWLQELYANRVGLQPGAMNTALNLDSRQDISVAGAYLLQHATQVWAQLPTVRTQKLEPQITSTDARGLLVIRIKVDAQAAGEGNIFRFSPGTVRLVVDNKQYFPIGTLTEGRLLRSRPDDPLFLNISGNDAFANMVFELNLNDVLTRGGDAVSFDAGAFLAVKRMALVSLADVRVQMTSPPSDQVLLKGGKLPESPTAGGSSAPSGAGVSSAGTPLNVQRTERSNTLFTRVNVGTPEDRITNARSRSGQFSLIERKFSRLELDGSEAIAMLNRGEYTVGALYAPAGMSIYQVVAIAPPGADADKWQWANDLRDFAVVTDQNTRFTPNGVAARVKVGTTDRIVAAYSAEGSVPAVPTVQDGIPTDVYLIFVIPADARISQVTFKGQALSPNSPVTP